MPRKEGGFLQAISPRGGEGRKKGEGRVWWGTPRPSYKEAKDLIFLGENCYQRVEEEKEKRYKRVVKCFSSLAMSKGNGSRKEGGHLGKDLTRGRRKKEEVWGKSRRIKRGAIGKRSMHLKLSCWEGKKWCRLLQQKEKKGGKSNAYSVKQVKAAISLDYLGEGDATKGKCPSVRLDAKEGEKGGNK